uniref:HDIG domain-containing metalloprotein n=1 Tax=Nocardioides massiliensis TaxID=1325935 RepID=UPI000AE86C5B
PAPRAPGPLAVSPPTRREVARRTLDELVADGRIHPTRIEEVHARAESEVEAHCRAAATDACLDVGIDGLHPDLQETLGRLAFRTSYGQNVLHHLVESAHAARLLAGELGVDPAIATRAAFLHDIGKALTHDSAHDPSHDVQGGHALVGADLARRCGEHADVVHAIEAHHNEVEPQTLEAFIVQAADAISGGRPGARRESTEDFQQRLRRLEALALSHDGVERAYAVSAGRDLRVLVLPDRVDDLGAAELARTLAKQIEAELSYPGQVAVTVIRESRTTEIAR